MNAFVKKHLNYSERFLKRTRKADASSHHVWSRIPTAVEHWNIAAAHSGHKSKKEATAFPTLLTSASEHRDWKWPKRPVFFIGDPHADAEAFVASLIATGGVTLTNPDKLTFKLTKLGRKAIFIIGGDCLDKGPSNLALLDAVKQLLETKARVKLIAGNHDMRLYMGIYAMGLKRHPETEHLFVRMGDKVIPLLTEIHTRYLKDKALAKSIPDEATCKTLLFPEADWFEQFPHHAKRLMTEEGIKRELHKMRRKYEKFEQACLNAGFTMREVYAIGLKCRQLFLEPKGEYAWFYKKMQLGYRSGSFLFLHAGLDDAITKSIEDKSVAHLNKQFRRQIKADLFQFYYGSLANAMRTKYRKSDLPLTEEGVKRINRQGIHALVQGHVNRKHGQRIVHKNGLLHIESDVTLDRHSRRKEGLEDYGIGVTVIHPKGNVIGISSDYAHAKVFHPNFYTAN